MGGHDAVLAVATVTGAEQQYGGQGDPAAHGVDDHRAGKVVELGAKGGLEPGLHTQVLVPGNAFKEGVDETDQHEGGGQLWVELGAFGDAARDDGGDRSGKGQQEEEAGDLVAALLGDFAGAHKKVGAVGDSEADGEVGDGRDGEVGQNFDQCVDLVLLADSAHFQKGKAGVHGQHHDGAEQDE